MTAPTRASPLRRASLERQTTAMPSRLWLVLVALVSVGVPAGASPSDCESIADPDARNYCRATTGKQASYCESIKDADLRNLCRAEVTGQRSYCESIKDPDMRARCRAGAG